MLAGLQITFRQWDVLFQQSLSHLLKSSIIKTKTFCSWRYVVVDFFVLWFFFLWFHRIFWSVWYYIWVENELLRFNFIHGICRLIWVCHSTGLHLSPSYFLLLLHLSRSYTDMPFLSSYTPFNFCLVSNFC